MQLTSTDGVKCVAEGFEAWGTCFLLKACFMLSSSLNLGFRLCSAWGVRMSSTPCSSYMMGFVPFPTPHTFSRIVVLPALALPMIRIRKQGHSYCALSIAIASSVSIFIVTFDCLDQWFDPHDSGIPVLKVSAISNSDLHNSKASGSGKGWYSKFKRSCTRQAMVRWP